MTATRVTILFVCTENACRSQVAEALITLKEKGAVEAESAGSQPAAVINDKTKRWLQEQGLSPEQYTPQSVTNRSHHSYDYVISMGCGDQCPSVPARHHLSWEVPDPKNLSYPGFEEVVDQIDTNIDQLLVKKESV